MKMVNFSDVVEFLEGPGVRNWQFRDSGIKLINIRNLVDNNIDLSNTSNFLDIKEVNEKYKHFLLSEGEFVMASSGVTWGKIAEVKKEHLPLCLNTSIIKLAPKSSLILDKRFLWHFIKSSAFRRQIDRIITGSAQPNFGPSHLYQVQIPLPPLPVQQKIAAILDAADAYRQKTKALIDKYDQLLKGCLYNALGDSIHISKRDLKSGTSDFLPNGFKWLNLNDLCEEISDIDHNMPASVDDGKLFLSAKDLLDDGELDFSNAKMISNEDFEKLSRKIKPRKGDIIYSRIGAKLGKARLVKTDADFLVSYSCCTIRPKYNLISGLYLRYYLDSEQTLSQANHSTKGIGVPDLGMNEIRNFMIPVPPKEIMNKIEIELNNIEIQKALIKASLQKAEDLFNSLLQKAFNGELVG